MSQSKRHAAAAAAPSPARRIAASGPDLVAAKREVFLAALATYGNISMSCREAGIGRATFYRWKADKADTNFSALVADAIETAADGLEQEAHRRAVVGFDEPVFGSLGPKQGDGQIGTIRRFSDQLLILLLKGARPEKYRDTSIRIKATVSPLSAEPEPVREDILSLTGDDLKEAMRARAEEMRARLIAATRDQS